jgi:hypothetical protein
MGSDATQRMHQPTSMRGWQKSHRRRQALKLSTLVSDHRGSGFQVLLALSHDRARRLLAQSQSLKEASGVFKTGRTVSIPRRDTPRSRPCIGRPRPPSVRSLRLQSVIALNKPVYSKNPSSPPPPPPGAAPLLIIGTNTPLLFLLLLQPLPGTLSRLTDVTGPSTGLSPGLLVFWNIVPNQRSRLSYSLSLHENAFQYQRPGIP